ncbi:MAG TPA: DUF1501 domain-containing protein [Pedobacter sp.]|jgi:uncharacterized protein (DUF1501 family)
MTTRRAFIKSGGLALFGIGIGGIPLFLTEAVAQINPPGLFKRKKILVGIFQRGAMDGLMAVTPFSDNYLKAARPNLFLSPDKSGARKPLTDLDGNFGLHPSMKAFEPYFRNKNLAIVHGIGSPNKSRSHFDAQDYMESGTPFKKGTESGWLNRAAALIHNDSPTPFQAVSLTSSLPRSLYGKHRALAINNINNFNVQTGYKSKNENVLAKGLEDLYNQSNSVLLGETGKESFEAIKILEQVDKNKYLPANGATYPNSSLGKSLKQIAQLIKMEVGLEIAFAESGGWDTHYNQGTDTGIFARNADDLSSSMMAFWTDIGTLQDDVILMTMTEFGRTVKQNGTGGTDHGRASCNFILGNSINGGVVHGKVPELSIENLEDGRDLPVTTDFRAVFSEIASTHLSIKDKGRLFPDWSGKDIGISKV